MTIQRFTGMRAFLIIWLGQLVSTLGSSLTGWGLGVWVYQRTGSTTLFALNLVALSLPSVALAPLAGLIVDRHDRRWIMILADVGAGLTTLGILVLFALGRLEVWHVYLATALNSAANTFQWPAFGAATTMLVPKSQLGRAGGMAQIGEGVSQIIAPGLAGLLFVTVGLTGIALVDILTFAFAVTATLLIAVPAPERATPEAAHESFWHEITFGWRYIAARPGLLGILIYFAAGNFFGSVSLPLLTPMLLDMTTPDTVGLIGSAAGAGMLAGTLFISAWGGAKRRALVIMIGDIVAGLMMIVTGLTPYVPLIIAAQFGFMFAIPVTNASSQALWQSKVAPDAQGRVFSIRRMIAVSILPVAFALAGPLSEQVFKPLLVEGGPLADSIGKIIGIGASRGIGLMMVVSGILCTLTAIAALIYPRSRRVDLELPDARPDEGVEPPDNAQVAQASL